MSMYVWNGRKSFSFFLFFLRKLLESCYLAEHLLERLHVQGGVVVLRAHWLNHLSQFSRHSRSHFPIAHCSLALTPPPPLVPLPETYSKRLQLLHRSLLADTVSHRAHDFYFSRAIEPLPFPKRRTYARGYLEFYKFFRGSLKNKRIDHRRY